MKGIISIVKYLADSGLLFKGVSKTTQNETEEQKKRILGAGLLENILAGKRINKAGEGIVRAGLEIKDKIMRTE